MTITLSKNEHLSNENIIKNGSFYTPTHIVKIAKDWLMPLINIEDVVMDFGVGYGAFISEFTSLSKKCIATDNDKMCFKYINSVAPSVKLYLENSLQNISRGKYGILENERLFIIGNPPYNDVTSQYKKGNKGSIEIDDIVLSRDLGISFMKMYSILKPEYICILHPLSYLIKKTNFKSLDFFLDNYLLEKGLIFSSNQFESIKKNNAEFPVVLTLYKKVNQNKSMTFEYIQNFGFNILGSDDKFRLNNFNTIDNWLSKYPTKVGKEDTDLQFYTIRDINALKRNKSFLTGPCNNGIKVTIENLYKYAWLDYFKNNFNPERMFLYGNLSPLYSSKLDSWGVTIELISYIFNNNSVVNNYINENKLEDKLKEYYKMDHFTNEYNLLQEILDSLI